MTIQPLHRHALRLLAVAALVVASLAGCGRGQNDRAAARWTTTITTAGIRFQAIVRGPSVRRAKAVVLFLHGASYTSRIWDDRKILDHLAAAGYRVVAVDLPGYGGTPERSTDDTTDGQPEGDSSGSLISDGAVLRELIRSVSGPAGVVLVSPSASGRYSLPYLAQFPSDPLAGFVPVAPVGVNSFRRPTTAPKIPTLLVWGAEDDVVPFANATLLQEQLPGSRIERIAGAGHAAYDDHPRQFEAVMLAFLRTLRR